MSTQPTHAYFGTPLDEWMDCYPYELERDAVGLWQVIPSLRKDFGLTGNALESATRTVLIALLDRGAHPIIGSIQHPGTWERITRYGETPAEIVDAVIAEWHASGRDPDVGDVWFGLPDFYLEA